MFDPERSLLIAGEYMRRGWTKISEYTVMEEFKYCPHGHTPVNDSTCDHSREYRMFPRMYAHLSREVEVPVN